jgi:ArsR family transcriptional regulator
MNDPTRQRSAALFSSLGNPIRIRIVELLGDDELSVNQISNALELPQSNTSQHLSALHRSGVLDVSPRGTSRMYRVRGPRIRRILCLIEQFCEVQGLMGKPVGEGPGL